jgi:endo-1,4-beta-xylanase
MPDEWKRTDREGRLRTLGAVAAAVVVSVVTAVAAAPTAAARVAAAPTAAAGVAAAPATVSCRGGYVGLTFDDGPTGSTTALLAALRANRLRATMFNIGQQVRQNPGLARAQRSAGMWVANHSWTHPHLPQLSPAEIRAELFRTQHAIRSATGVRPRLFRPPFGETDATVRAIATQLGLTEVLWDVDSQDWNGASTAQIVEAVGRLTDGQVILMHDGIQNTIDAIPQIASGLAARGLCPGMISPITGRAVAPHRGGPPRGGGG